MQSRAAALAAALSLILLFAVPVAASAESQGTPASLLLIPEPGHLLYGERGLVAVQLVDQQGNPVPAPYNLTVYITSYPPSVVSHQDFVVIPKGSSIAYAWIAAGKSSGVAYLVASAEGVNASPPTPVYVGVGQPRLLVTVMPSSAISSVPGSPWALILVQLVSASGSPILASSPVEVYLSSSNSCVLGLENTTLVISPGSDHAVGYAYIGHVNGTAVVTAQAQWFIPGNASFTAYAGPYPTSCCQFNSTAFYGPPVMASGQAYPFLVAEVAPGGFAIPIPPDIYGSTVPIAVTSSDPYVANSSSPLVEPYSEIGWPSPSGYLLAGEPGAVTFTAAPSSQFEGSYAGSFSSTVEQPGSYGSGFPAALSISGPPHVSQGSEAVYAVQLVDQQGNPVPAPYNLTVYITYSPINWSGSLPGPQVITILAGSSRAYFDLEAQGYGNLSAQAAAEGVQPASLVIESIQEVSAVNSTPTSYVVPLSVLALAQPGGPLAGVDVTVLSGGREVASAVTGSGGLATFQLKAPGLYTVEVSNSTSPRPGAYAIFSSMQPAGVGPEVTLNLTAPANVTAYYSMYYSVVATSEYGKVKGTGLYPAGSVAIVSVEPTVISGFPADRVFSGWVGTLSSRSPSFSFVVNSPVYLAAKWSLDWLPLYVVAAVVVLAAAAAALLLIARARA